MIRQKLQAYAAATIIILATAVTYARAAPLNLTLAGASPNGLWSLIGAGINAAVKAADPASTITYQTSGGGFANAALVARGRVDMGLAHNAELKLALAGRPPFHRPVSGLRAIACLYNWSPMQFFLNKAVADKYRIHSLADISARKAPLRVAVNRAGNIAGDIAVFMLARAGVGEKQLESWGGTVVQAGSSEQGNLIVDGRIDLIANSLFVRHSSIREVENTMDVVPLSIPDDVVKATNAKFGTQSFVIPAGTYKHQQENIVSPSLAAVLVVNKNMDTATAYTLTRALIDHLAALRSVHKSMAQLTPALLVSEDPLPLHPGAVRAYREAGLIR